MFTLGEVRQRAAVVTTNTVFPMMLDDDPRLIEMDRREFVMFHSTLCFVRSVIAAFRYYTFTPRPQLQPLGEPVILF